MILLYGFTFIGVLGMILALYGVFRGLNGINKAQSRANMQKIKLLKAVIKGDYNG